MEQILGCQLSQLCEHFLHLLLWNAECHLPVYFSSFQMLCVSEVHFAYILFQPRCCLCSRLIVLYSTTVRHERLQVWRRNGGTCSVNRITQYCPNSFRVLWGLIYIRFSWHPVFDILPSATGIFSVWISLGNDPKLNAKIQRWFQRLKVVVHIFQGGQWRSPLLLLHLLIKYFRHRRWVLSTCGIQLGVSLLLRNRVRQFLQYYLVFYLLPVKEVHSQPNRKLGYNF